MTRDLKNFYDKTTELDGRGLTIGIVYDRHDEFNTHPNIYSAIKSLEALGVKRQDIPIQSVPLVTAIPFGVQKLIRDKLDAIIVITSHVQSSIATCDPYHLQVGSELMGLQSKYDIPVVFYPCPNTSSYQGYKTEDYFGWRLARWGVEMAMMNEPEDKPEDSEFVLIN